MDKDQFSKRWIEIRGRVKDNWGRLTDRELDQVRGNAKLLIGMIQEKYDEPRKVVEIQLSRFVDLRPGP